MQELNKLETLRDIIDKGEYIVALCGSGMMEECGIHPLKDQDRAYRIEEVWTLPGVPLHGCLF